MCVHEAELGDQCCSAVAQGRASPQRDTHQVLSDGGLLSGPPRGLTWTAVV